MRFRSLQSRMVLFFVALLVVVLGTALILVEAASLRNARANIKQELDVGERVFRRLLAQNSRQLTQAAEILSSDFAFRGAVATRDLETIRSVLANHGARIRADQMSLVSLERQVIADTLDPAGAGRPAAFGRLLDVAEGNGKAAGIVLVGGRAYQIALVPVLAPEPIAWAAFGFVMDDRLAKDLQNLSALDVSFLYRIKGEPWKVLGSTVSGELQEALRRSLTADRVPLQQSMSLDLAGKEYETLVLPLEQSNEAAFVAVLQRSVEEALAPSRRLGTILIVLAVGSIAVSVIGSVLIARGITRPISVLSEMTRRIEEGDYSRAVEVPGADEIGELARRFNLMREGIAAREEQITKLAYRDVLTELPNRALFNDRLAVAIETAKRVNAPLAVLLMDLDRFKSINDALGHDVGDQVLQQVARRLPGLVRKADTVARLGGDEFAILLVNARVEEGGGVAQKILAAMEEPIEVGAQSFDVRASIGVSCFPLHGDTPETLMRHADGAMYAAKRANAGIAVYDPRSHEQREDELSLLSELRRAIEREELQLAYQPKIDLTTGSVPGAEALLRWRHPEKGFVPPDHFVPFAEQTGFIRSITRWVIEAAARQAAAWRATGLAMKVSVNVAAQDLFSQDFADFVRAALDRNGLPAGALCLEITESGVMQDPAHAIELLKRLQALGIGLSIDDFGTGHSSLAYVKQFSVDEIKIDRSFVRNIVSDDKDRAIVLTMIELAHNLGLSVVAEGVEDEPCADMLRRLGCDQAQGYFYAKPLEPVAFTQWLAQRAVPGVPVASAL